MADIRSSQNLAQVEWQDPFNIIVSQNLAQIEWQDTSNIKVFQTLVQVEWSDIPAGWTGKMNSITNPAKINGVAVANIASVVGQ